MIFMTDCMNSVSENKGSSCTQPDKKEYVFETTNKYIDSCYNEYGFAELR